MLNFKETSDLAICFDNLQLLATEKSKLQEIAIYCHPLLGKILTINNEVQHVENWAPFYHEILVHLPIAFIPEVKNVLILGGGSLFAAFEILRYKSVKKVVLIDHDICVLNVIHKHYPHANSVMKDKRFETRINDAFKGVEQIKNESFDLIINDSVDLIGHGCLLNTDLLYLLSTKLTKYGICSDVVYRHIFERTTTLQTIHCLKKQYHSTFSLITVPEYPGIFHVLYLWSKTNEFLLNTLLINKIQIEWLKRNNNPCQYYNPQFLNFYCYFPRYLKTMLVG